MTAPTTAPNTAAPASPPLPARHTAVAPGPRATALQQAFDEALNRTLAKLEWDKFAACYPTVSARAPNSLRSVQQRVVGLLSEKCRVCLFLLYILILTGSSCFCPGRSVGRTGVAGLCVGGLAEIITVILCGMANLAVTWYQKEFQIILDERQVVPKLNELEALVSEAAMRRKDAGDAEPGM